MAVTSTPVDSVPAHARLPARRAAEFTGPQIAFLSALLLVIAAIPVFTHPLPPLSDYVNHLARMQVIATQGTDPDLSRFYEIQWQVIPNLVMDLIVPRLARFMNIYLAGQMFTLSTFVLIISGTLVLHRTLFGRWSILPLVALPLLYNHVFLVGLMNYMFGFGLSIWGLAAWLLLRERAWPLRLAVSAAFVVAIFFAHLSALGVYGIGLLAVELQRLWATRRQPLVPRIAGFVSAGLPFLPVIPLLLESPTMTLATENHWEPQGKIDGLIFTISVYSDIVAFAIIAIVVSGMAWAIRRGLLRFHPIGWAVLAVGGFIYLVMPRVVFATYMADQRIPIALVFMLVACVHLEMRHRVVRRGFLALVLVILVVRVIEVDVSWADLSRTTLDFRDSVKRIKRGSTVLVAYADRMSGDDVRDLGLVHAACAAMIERSALVTTAFTVRGKQIMHVRPQYAARVDTEDGTPPSVAQLLVAADDDEVPGYWNGWTRNFDYVYILFTEQDAENPAPDLLTLAYDGPRFQLYRVKKAPQRVTTAVPSPARQTAPQSPR